ncbi:DUF1499 domain-containing protein [Nitrospina watsonii]|nr:DUF1499 domain-containing protein [Nitrospina watsonii]
MLCFVLACSGTRPDHLGVAEQRLAPCPDSPNCVSSFAKDAEHRVEPMSFDGAPEQVMQALQKVLQQHDRVEIVTQEPLYLYAEFTSFVFRFVDDVEFLIDPATKTLHFRSASRIGRSDLGVNRERIESLRRDLARQKL